MNRKDIIFCKMLTYECLPLGSFEAPVIINESVLKEGLRREHPPIMKHIKNWISSESENRMAVFTTKDGNSWAIMNTDRVSLDKSRNIYWVHARTTPKPWMQTSLNPVWITVHRQTFVR